MRINWAVSTKIKLKRLGFYFNFQIHSLTCSCIAEWCLGKLVVCAPAGCLLLCPCLAKIGCLVTRDWSPLIDNSPLLAGVGPRFTVTSSGTTLPSRCWRLSTSISPQNAAKTTTTRSFISTNSKVCQRSNRLYCQLDWKQTERIVGKALLTNCIKTLFGYFLQNDPKKHHGMYNAYFYRLN